MLLLSPKPAANRVPESFLTAGAAALGHISKEHPESLQIAMRDSLAMRGIQRPKIWAAYSIVFPGKSGVPLVHRSARRNRGVEISLNFKSAFQLTTVIGAPLIEDAIIATASS